MKNTYDPIAIVGIGLAYPPNIFDKNDFFDFINNGANGIDIINDNVWDKSKYYSSKHESEDKTYCDKSGYLKRMPNDYELLKKFNIDNVKYYELNKTQKLMLHTILSAIDMNDNDLITYEKSLMVVGNMLGDESYSNFVLANRYNEYFKLAKVFDSQLLNEFKKKVFNKFVDNKISKFNIFPSNLLEGIKDILGLSGISFTLDGACSGSVLAIDEAIKNIHLGECKNAIVTGVLGNIGVTGNVSFSKIGALSDDTANPLDESANGLIPGEGCGTVILKRLHDAEIDGDKILGVISGSGVSSDGSGKSIYAPSSEGQYRAMNKSLYRSGLDFSEIDYVEMHATGTPVGDKVELKALENLFKDYRRDNDLFVGSMKHQIGHSFSAAGMANLFKILVFFNEKNYPKTFGFEKFPKDVSSSINSKIKVVNKDIPWENNKVKTAMVNAFGFGGINANLIVQEYKKDYFNMQNHKFELDDIYQINGIGFVSNEFSSVKNFTKQQQSDFKFPFLKYKLPPKVVEKIDNAQKIGLMAANEAMDDAKNILSNIRRDKIGLFVGSMMGLEKSTEYDSRIRSSELKDLLKELCPNVSNDDVEKNFKNMFTKLSEDSLPGFMDNIVAGRISNSLDIKGANLIIDAGDNSFVLSLKQAINSLNISEYDAVVVGAVHSNNDENYLYLKNKSDGNFIKNPHKSACFFVITKKSSNHNPYGYITMPKKTKDKTNKISKYTDYVGTHDAVELLDSILNKNKCWLSTKCFFDRFKYQYLPELDINPFKTAYFKTYNPNIIQRLASNDNFSNEPSDGDKLAILYKNKEELINKISIYKTIKGDK